MDVFINTELGTIAFGGLVVPLGKVLVNGARMELGVLAIAARPEPGRLYSFEHTDEEIIGFSYRPHDSHPEGWN